MRRRNVRGARVPRGKYLIMLALLLPVIFGSLAVAVDLGVLAVARSELQMISDSAALAGVRELATENRVRGVSNISTEMTSAQSSATSYSQSNRVLGTKPVVLANGNNSSSGDIVCGYTDPTIHNAPFVNSSGAQSLFNSVQVTTFRDGTHGSLLPSFFSLALGKSGSPMYVTSVARGQVYNANGVQADKAGLLNAMLLPITLDLPTYTAMINKTTTDQYTFNPSDGTVTSGPDGVTESQLYPVKNGDPGNWGTLKVGVSNNSTAILSAQIRYGITPAQLATYPNSTIQLDQSLSPPSITMSGNPGISAGIKDDLTAIIGQPRMLPIYDQTGGNGSNATYRVINLVGVRIMAVNFQGNPKYVIIQPAIVVDGTGIAGSAVPWTNGGLLRLNLIK